MDTLPLGAPIVNPPTVANPRDTWLSWADEDRWEPGPIDLEDTGGNGDGGEPRLAMAGWIEARSGMLRPMGSDPAGWPARKFDGIAWECRSPDAEAQNERCDAEGDGL